MSSSQQIIDQTITWIHKVVVGCNFCPFAARTLQQHHVHYQVESSTNTTLCMDAFFKEIARLDKELHIETSFLIFSNAFQQFDDFTFHVIEDVEYDHVVHEGSEWLRTYQSCCVYYVNHILPTIKNL